MASRVIERNARRMKCGGTYRHGKQTHDCGKKWDCVNYTFRIKLQTVPVSRTDECEYFEPMFKNNRDDNTKN